MENKIFGIGLSKTGTSSLTRAFNMLGFKYIHYPTQDELFNLEGVLGACDIPVVRFYKKLDDYFPKSKFIYTKREKDGWLRSIKNHMSKKHTTSIPKEWQENRIAVYGQLEFDEKLFSDVYDRHEEDIKKYFKKRKEDLLTLNICAGEGWEELLNFTGIICSFGLNNIPFPHKNKRQKHHETLKR